MAGTLGAQGVRLSVDSRLYDKLRTRLGRDDDFRAIFQIVKHASAADGAVGPAALRRAFTRLMAEPLDQATAEGLFMRMDADGDGELSPVDLQTWAHTATTRHAFLTKETPQYHTELEPLGRMTDRVATRARGLHAKLLTKVKQLHGGSAEAMVCFPLDKMLSLSDFRVGVTKLVGDAPDAVLCALMALLSSGPAGKMSRDDLRRALTVDVAAVPETAAGFHRSGLGIHLPHEVEGLPKLRTKETASAHLPSFIEKGGAKRYQESAPAWATQQFSALELQRQQTAMVPGYSGFVPGLPLTVGSTYADATRQTTTKDRTELIHNPEDLPGVGPRGCPRGAHERWGVPGYGGYIVGTTSQRLVGTSPWATHLLVSEKDEHNTEVDQKLEEIRSGLQAHVAQETSLLAAFCALGADASGRIPKATFLRSVRARCACDVSDEALAEDAFAVLDADGDGAIGMVDFVQGCL